MTTRFVPAKELRIGDVIPSDIPTRREHAEFDETVVGLELCQGCAVLTLSCPDSFIATLIYTAEYIVEVKTETP